MEFMREEIRIEKPVAELLSAAVAEGEVKIPDDMPPVSRIFCCEPRISGVQTKTEQGNIGVSGMVEFTVVYGNDAPVASATARCPFSHNLSAQHVTQGMSASVRCTPTQATARRVGDYAVKVECIVQMEADAVDTQKDVMHSGVSDKQIEVSSQPVCWSSLVSQSNAASTIREDVELPAGLPDIQNVLLPTGRLAVQDVRVRDGQALLIGNLMLNVLYSTGIDAMPIQSADFEIPFSTALNVNSTDNDVFVSAHGDIHDLLLHAFEDVSGQRRILSVEAPVEFKADCYASGHSVLLRDAYGLTHDLYLERQPVQLSETPRVRTGEVLVSGAIMIQDTQPDVVRVLHVSVRPMVDSILASRDRLGFSGRLMTRMFYLADENQVACTESEAPFDGAFDMPGITAETHIQLQAFCLQATAQRSVSGSFDVRAQLEVHAMARQATPLDIITSITEGNVIDRESLAPLMLVMVGPEESEWSLAQRCRVPLKTLMDMNPEIADRGIRAGDRLVVLRK